jgi:hypothetical protein
MKLRIWMSAPDARDMDVFVAVQKLDAYGDLTGFPFYAVFEDGPVALACPCCPASQVGAGRWLFCPIV